MAIPVRRLALQLTPMLDLMLIVLFSQYLENRERSESQFQDLQREQAAVQQQAQEQQARMEQELQRINQIAATYDQRYRSMLSQHQTAAEILRRNLNLPERALQQILELQSAERGQDAERLEQAVGRLQTQLNSGGDDLFHFLMQVDEMQKRVTFWEVHISAAGSAVISNGQGQFMADFSSPEEFASRISMLSQKFSDPHNLVLVLLTWGDRASLRYRLAAQQGLPMLLEVLRRDAGGTRWFDSTVIGHCPNGPQLFQLQSLQ